MRWLLGLAVLAVFGCSGASWEARQWTRPGRPPSHLVIRIYGDVDSDGPEDPMSAFRQALVETLSKHGISAFVTVSPVRPPPPPRVDLRVVDGDSGNEALAWALGGSSQGWMIVECTTHMPAGTAFSFQGRVEGQGGDIAQAAAEVGRAIAEELASGGR